jgi:hypothetical protein
MKGWDGRRKELCQLSDYGRPIVLAVLNVQVIT